MRPQKPLQLFISKVRNCKHFSDSNYINNSYLNYVRIKKTPEENKKEEQKEKTQQHLKFDRGNKKDTNSFKNSNSLNTSGNSKRQSFVTASEEESVKDKSYETNEEIDEHNFSEDAIPKKQKIKKKNYMEGRCNPENINFVNSANDENTYQLFREEEANKTYKQFNESNEKPFQQDTIQSKGHSDDEPYRENKGKCDTQDEKNSVDNGKRNYNDEETRYNKCSQKNEKDEDINFDVDETGNIGNTRDMSDKKMNRANESLDEDEFEKMNISDTVNMGNKKKEKNVASDNSNNIDSDDGSKENSDMFEEDIPNIFEVDENLTEEEKKEKLKLIKLITEKLAGPLKSNKCENSSTEESKENLTGDEKITNDEESLFADNRPIAIEVDGPSHFYANSNRYTTYTKLKHRILTKLGYNVIHISYIDWRKLRNKSEREEFILKKLKEKNDEFLDDNDRIYYNERMKMIKEDYMKYMKQKNKKVAELIEDVKRISHLSKLITALEAKRDLCNDEDALVISGQRDPTTPEGDLISRFYQVTFSCGKGFLGKEPATMNCILKDLKKKKIEVTPSCVFCFVKFISCAKQNCSAKCSLKVCSSSCISCSKKYCEEDMQKCTGRVDIPYPCKEV